MNSNSNTYFEYDGYAHLENIYSIDQIGNIIAVCNDIIGNITEYPGCRVYFEPDGVSIKQIENIIGSSPLLQRLVQTTKLISNIENLVNHRVVRFKDKLNAKGPAGSGYAPHRDGCFWWTDQQGQRQPGWGAYCQSFTSAAIALDSSTDKAGCIYVAPGQHVGRTIEQFVELEYTEQYDRFKYQKCPMNPGDVLVFDAMLPHFSRQNRTKHLRRVLYITFNDEKEGNFESSYYIDKDFSLNAGNKNR